MRIESPSIISQLSVSNSCTNSGNILSISSIEARGIRQESAASDSDKLYDFTDISPYELSKLIQSGDLKVDRFILALPEQGVDLAGDTTGQMNEAFHKKINLLEFVEKQISYRASQNMSVDLYQDLKDKLHHLQDDLQYRKIDDLA